MKNDNQNNFYIFKFERGHTKDAHPTSLNAESFFIRKKWFLCVNGFFIRIKPLKTLQIQTE